MNYTTSPETSEKSRFLGNKVYCRMVEDEGIVSRN